MNPKPMPINPKTGRHFKSRMYWTIMGLTVNKPRTINLKDRTSAYDIAKLLGVKITTSIENFPDAPELNRGMVRVWRIQ